ncbi:MAG: hypothetical protein WCD11_16340 [Solirubrobacteraceae bacterium]
MKANWTRLPCLSIGIGAIALGVAAPAGAQGCCTLSLSGAPSGTVGTPYAITASGTDVPADEGPYYLEIDAIPASFTTTCPAGYLNGGQLAGSSGGSDVAFDEPENVDSSGNFSNPNGFTAKTAGSVLFCGYTDDGATDTLATASQIVDFQAASTGGGGGGGGGPTGQGAVKPANTTKPRVTRSGNRLRCTTGTWANSPTGFAYHWLVGGKTKAGARSATLTVTHLFRGHKVQCGVKASNSAGSASALSAPFRVH